MKEPDIHALLLVVSDACRYRPKYYFYFHFNVYQYYTIPYSGCSSFPPVCWARGKGLFTELQV